MNENLNNALAALVNNIVSAIEPAKGVVTNQLPEVIEQLITWKLFYNSIWLVVSVICIAVCFIFLIAIRKSHSKKDESIWWKKFNRSGDSLSFCGFIVATTSAILFFAFSLVAVDSSMEIIKITMVEKVWLIEYAANLIK